MEDLQQIFDALWKDLKMIVRAGVNRNKLKSTPNNNVSETQAILWQHIYLCIEYWVDPIMHFFHFVSEAPKFKYLFFFSFFVS